MTNYWKVICCICGVNCDLLINRYGRVVCREDHYKYDLKEVDSELEDLDEPNCEENDEKEERLEAIRNPSPINKALSESDIRNAGSYGLHGEE